MQVITENPPPHILTEIVHRYTPDHPAYPWMFKSGFYKRSLFEQKNKKGFLGGILGNMNGYFVPGADIRYDQINVASGQLHAVQVDAILFQIYYYFSLSVSFLRVPDRRRYFTQSITLVYDRSHFARLHEVAQKNQVILMYFRQQIDELLSHE